MRGPSALPMKRHAHAAMRTFTEYSHNYGFTIEPWKEAKD
jgi:hypothetical protein